METSDPGSDLISVSPPALISTGTPNRSIWMILLMTVELLQPLVLFEFIVFSFCIIISFMLIVTQKVCQSYYYLSNSGLNIESHFKNWIFMVTLNCVVPLRKEYRWVDEISYQNCR